MHLMLEQICTEKLPFFLRSLFREKQLYVLKLKDSWHHFIANFWPQSLRAKHIPARQAGPTSVATTRDAKHHTQAAQAEEQIL